MNAQVESTGSDEYQKFLKLDYDVIDSLMVVNYKKGNFTTCIALTKAGRENAKNELGEKDALFIEYTRRLGFFYDRMGNYNKALPLMIQVMNIKGEVLGKKDPKFANSLDGLAVLYREMGNYAKALPLLIQAMNINKEALGEEHPTVALSLNNLGQLYREMNNNGKALPLLYQATNIYKKVLGEEHPSFALSINNLGALYQEMNDYEKALPLLIQAANIKEKVLGKEHPKFAVSLNNLGALYQEMNKHEKALPLLIQATDIRKKALGKGHAAFSLSLNNLAFIYFNIGDYEKAWEILHQVLDNLSKRSVPRTIGADWSDSLYTAPYHSNKHLEQMIKSLEIANHLLSKDTSIVDVKNKKIIVADLVMKLLTKLQRSLSSEQDKLRLLAKSSNWLQKNLEVLSPEMHSKKAFSLSDQNKSVLLLQATKSGEAYHLGELPDSLILQDKKLLKKQSILQAKLLQKRTPEEKNSLRSDLNDVNQAMENFAKLIEKNYPKYHKLKYQQVNAKVEELQMLLDDKTALLEYVITNAVVHIFYIDQQQIEWKKIPLSHKKLKHEIRNLHDGLSNYKVVLKDEMMAYQSYTKQAHWFYQKLIAPVLKNKTNIKDLILVTDGELGHLPFETFLIEPAPQKLTSYHKLHYLVNDYNISYNYSATLWKENMEAPTPSNNGQIMALAANYNLELDSTLIASRLASEQALRKTLIPLPAARKEVEILEKKYEGLFVFDEFASERTVKEKAGNYAILHFATHGILDDKTPVLSALVLSEDNDLVESNFWQAHEISKIQLHANLVVLSACETGFGKFEKGNGIASLARAFMYAGASSLIVSLWQVNDFVTAEIMKNIYKNLDKGMKKDEALRQAKLLYMNSVKGQVGHPVFWSPFILMGKTDAVQIQQKGNPTMIWGLALGVLVLLGIGGLIRRR